MADENERKKYFDNSSLSNAGDYLCTKIGWDVLVCFDRKVLECTANIEFITKSDNVENLILDTSDLKIIDVKDLEDGSKISFSLSNVYKVESFGRQLIITLPPKYQNCGSRFCLSISYQTSPNASALQWLTPEQTAGKKQPYLFTQCQPNHARSIIPCQDTPSVKFPYEASVSVPKELVALTSACRAGEGSDPNIGENKIYKFKQQVPIPSYLFALVVGALSSRKIGPRSHVWSERETIEECAYEFAQVEDMIQAGEKLLGPYVWGIYDLLVLPPSFPYGGMENPCLTFVTPTLLAGDRSLADVVVHEISHSWTGNLVTNQNWEHFWLNEGFTRFVEGKIVGRLHGEPTRHLKAIGGWKSLIDAVQKFQSTNPAFSCLVVNLEGYDPDDAFSSVPYEKGAAFLFYLEQLVGNESEFEGCLKAWIDTYKYKTVVTDDWKNFFIQYFKDKVDKGVLDKIQWKEWFYAQGMPPVDMTLQYDTSLADVCTELSQRWLQASDNDLSSFTSADIRDFTPAQTTVFLDKLLLEKPMDVSKLAVMEREYHFNSVRNSEIRFRWLHLCIRSGWKAAFPLTVEFLLQQGRMKYIRPLYEALYKCEKSRELALKTFQDNRHIYHPIAVAMVAKELRLAS